MNQLAVRLLLGSAVVLQVSGLLGGCSDDDGTDVPAKDPTAQAGTGGDGTSGAAGMGGGVTGGSGGGGGGTTQPPPDAGMTDVCTPVFLDAGVPADAGDAGDAGPNNGPVSFSADIYPIVRSLCTTCHENEYSGGHNIAAPTVAEAYTFIDMPTDDLRFSLLDRVNGGGMPPDCTGFPGDPGCLTVAQFDLLRRWAAQCFPL